MCLYCNVIVRAVVKLVECCLACFRRVLALFNLSHSFLQTDTFTEYVRHLPEFQLLTMKSRDNMEELPEDGLLNGHLTEL